MASSLIRRSTFLIKESVVSKKMKYAEAGVDIDRANRLVKDIAPLVASTFTRGVITDIGGFAGMFALDKDEYEAPVLVSATDGVGTKLMVAFMANRHDTVGIDLVAMSINDIVVTGAKPLFFLDYFATGKLDEGIAKAVISGVAEGCRQAECALIGGETAEMPGMYPDNEYDLAGFGVGIVDKNKVINGSEIALGHDIIGIASSGLHSNGYSLVRKLFFQELGLSIHDEPDELQGKSVAEVLLSPTRIYARAVTNLVRRFKIDGIVHITGGGFQDNIPRVLPDTVKAVIHLKSWYVHPVFKFIQKKAKMDYLEMLRTFNCGIGLVFIVDPSQTEDLVLQLQALEEEPFVIGRIEQRGEDEPQVEFRGDALF